MTRDLRKELEAFSGETRREWRPKGGDVIAGTLLAYDQGDTKWGKCRIAVLREEPTGELREVWLGHKVLSEEFNREHPEVGERLAIKCLGDRQSENGRHYNLYKLLVDREDGQESGGASTEVPEDDIPF